MMKCSKTKGLVGTQQNGESLHACTCSQCNILQEMAVDDCKGETQHVIEKGDCNNLMEKDSRNEIEQLIVADK